MKKFEDAFTETANMQVMMMICIALFAGASYADPQLPFFEFLFKTVLAGVLALLPLFLLWFACLALELNENNPRGLKVFAYIAIMAICIFLGSRI